VDTDTYRQTDRQTYIQAEAEAQWHAVVSRQRTQSQQMTLETSHTTSQYPANQMQHIHCTNIQTVHDFIGISCTLHSSYTSVSSDVSYYCKVLLLLQCSVIPICL